MTIKFNTEDTWNFSVQFLFSIRSDQTSFDVKKVLTTKCLDIFTGNDVVVLTTIGSWLPPAMVFYRIHLFHIWIHVRWMIKFCQSVDDPCELLIVQSSISFDSNYTWIASGVHNTNNHTHHTAKKNRMSFYDLSWMSFISKVISWWFRKGWQNDNSLASFSYPYLFLTTKLVI